MKSWRSEVLHLGRQRVDDDLAAFSPGTGRSLKCRRVRTPLAKAEPLFSYFSILSISCFNRRHIIC